VCVHSVRLVDSGFFVRPQTFLQQRFRLCQRGGPRAARDDFEEA